MEHLADRVKQTTVTTGTGAITLDTPAPDGFQTFSNAFGTNKWFYYVIYDTVNFGWEVGRGYLSATNTLQRSRVYRSTNGNAAINLSAGPNDVFCDANSFFFDNLYGRILAMSKSAAMP